jgi:hypothetical protein
VRYLAQQPNTSLVTQDVYNDFFAYQGPEVHLRTNHVLPARIQIVIECELRAKSFSVPALTVTGAETGQKRKDLRSNLELSLARYFELFGNLGVDFTLDASVMRNQSNDDYSDYSLYTVSGSVGLSF